MISQVLDVHGKPLVTSDKWHVIHAEWVLGTAAPEFVRTIVSEHASSSSALRHARELKAELVRRMHTRSQETWDQVIVRRPFSETTKVAGRVSKGSSRVP